MNIWITRNSNLYNKRKKSINLENAIYQAIEFIHIGSKCNRQENNSKEQILVKWKPPRKGYKLNIDGAALGNPGQGGTGGVFRDEKGIWILGYMSNLAYTTNNMEELTALLQGLRLAREFHLTPLTISTYSTVVIDILKNDHPMYTNQILECRELLDLLANPLIQHDYRETNQVADFLAKNGSQLAGAHRLVSWIVPPLFVQQQLEADRAGTFFATLSRNSRRCFESCEAESEDQQFGKEKVFVNPIEDGISSIYPARNSNIVTSDPCM